MYVLCDIMYLIAALTGLDFHNPFIPQSSFIATETTHLVISSS